MHQQISAQCFLEAKPSYTFTTFMYSYFDIIKNSFEAKNFCKSFLLENLRDRKVTSRQRGKVTSDFHKKAELLNQHFVTQ